MIEKEVMESYKKLYKVFQKDKGIIDSMNKNECLVYHIKYKDQVVGYGIDFTQKLPVNCTTKHYLEIGDKSFNYFISRFMSQFDTRHPDEKFLKDPIGKEVFAGYTC